MNTHKGGPLAQTEMAAAEPTVSTDKDSDTFTGLYRYFIVQSSLTRGKFPSARLEVHTVSLLLGILTGVVFGVLVSFPR